jgi:RNA polymerase sigma-70 factor, ECF subfamily
MLLKGFWGKEKDMSDEDLLARYNATGNLEALAALYSRYTPLVYGVCLKYLKNREDARDAVMSIYEKVATGHGKHNPANFRAWLYVVSKNFCLMEIRSAEAERSRYDEWVAVQEYFMEPGAVLHPVDREDSRNDRELMDCIEKLMQMQRESIELFYFGNKCYREIAEHLKTDEKRVKSLLQNGKRNLKICMEEKNVRN